MFDTEKTGTELLQDRLAESTDLMLHARQAYWSVRGEGADEIRSLFGEIHERSRAWGDELAETLAGLGEVAGGTRQAVTRRSAMPEFPLERMSGKEHLEALSHCLAVFAEGLEFTIAHSFAGASRMSVAECLHRIMRSVDGSLGHVECFLRAQKGVAHREAA